MTFDEFIEALRQTPRTWRLEPDGKLRSISPRCCPITSLTSSFEPAQVGPAGKELGLSVAQVADLIIASDSNKLLELPRLAELRARLLEACGVEEVAKLP